MKIRIDDNGAVGVKCEWCLCFGFGTIDVLVAGLKEKHLRRLKKIIERELKQ